MIFGTSALLVASGRAPIALGAADEEPAWRTIWEAADAIGPVAKLAMITLFAASVHLPARRWMDEARGAVALAGGAVRGAVTMLLTLVLLPAPLSRGFGIGLTGARLDPAVFPLYVIGGTLGGLTFVMMWRRAAVAPGR